MSDDSDCELKIYSDDEIREVIRRKMPQNYQDLMCVMSELEETAAIDTNLVLELREIFEVINVLLQKYKNDKNQLILDSILIRRICSLQLRCFIAINNKLNTYNSKLFAFHLKKNLGDVMQNLTKVTNTFISPLPRIQGILMMRLNEYTNSVEEEEEEESITKRNQLETKRARKRPRLEPLTNVIRPETVDRVVEEEVNSKDIKKLSTRILNKFDESHKSNLDFYKTLISRKSFGKTIENMFFFSFLIHDHAFSVDINRNNSVQIRKMTNNINSNQKTDTDQFIASFDFLEWKDMCNKLNNNQEQISESESDSETD